MPTRSATGGEQAGDDLLRYLAGHSYTAQNLARKLCVRLVSDNPSGALVTAVANAYLDGKTQILPMVSTILRSTEFWESRGQEGPPPGREPARHHPDPRRQRRRTGRTAMSTLHWMTSAIGNVPLDWPAPNGYPDVAASWRSAGTLLNTWNYHLGFAGGWWGTFPAVDPNVLYGGTPANSGDAIDRLTRRLTGQAWTATHRAALQKFLNEPASTTMARSVLRWMAVPLIGIILDAPHHALR